MKQTFDEKYQKIIEGMKKYLLEQKMRSIEFTFEDGFKFKLGIPMKDFVKLSRKKKN